jgi:hypothetical protein
MNLEELNGSELAAAARRLAARIRRRLGQAVVDPMQDPERRELLRRSTETLALTGMLGVGFEHDADLADQVRAAFAVLTSLLSAQEEEAAAAVRQAVRDAIGEAMKISLAGLLAAMHL